ncbi:MAG: glutathione S-transferase family protein [Alphaproteobacteria bacterium]|jgi:glutathione S-transferase|nr:glutathione S-transferase family protein [Alphaproteobacteria bacterium]MBT4086253.1 glutathione S-transferase family protein [Alphaproteobacteria bacterium]MBT4543870.1 glutathione S-transferase family protein [Alphaproteobacteria bacterium]MBT7744881.1 glutathione S-transferase family protein [Alphaproteobacteria bacterium]
MSDLIFHHYPQSPVAEKVRVGMGLKKLSWHSVEIPRIPPKPDLMPLTGGYRRTPVMQFGADIFCDSQSILRELERRYPEPTFFSERSGGLEWGISRWTDTDLFIAMIKLILSVSADSIPAEFVKDRTRLYLGENADLREVAKNIPHLVSQIRAQLGWIEQRLAEELDFISGDKPGLPDAQFYYLIWFLRGRWDGGPGLLSEFPALEAWEARIQEIGHGTSTELSSTEALVIAKASTTEFSLDIDVRDPLALEAGQIIGVTPDEDGGDPIVTGSLHILTKDKVAILREEERVGQVCVHFPRVGYKISQV